MSNSSSSGPLALAASTDDGTHALARTPPPVIPALSREDVETLKRTKCVGASDSELKLYLATCRRTGLDPFANQIHFVKRPNHPASFQIGIDGFRLVAERTGRYEGQDGPYWCGSDGIWKDVWLHNAPPAASKVGVFRAGFRGTLWGTARFSSFAATKADGALNRFWNQMGDLMIAKCAEALALRRAFPNELSGLYTPEEMMQTSNQQARPAEEPRREGTAGLVERFRSEIAKASSPDDLECVGLAIKEFDLSDEEREVLEDIYRKRSAALAGK